MPKKQSLLDKAKVPVKDTPWARRETTREHAELVVALYKGEITNTQFARALDVSAANAGHYAFSVLKESIRLKLVTLTLTPKK